MKPWSIAISMTCMLTIVSCKGKQTNYHETQQLQLKQDTITKINTQPILDETVKFDHSTLQNLKHNKSYERFLAGKLNVTTGQVVCADPMYRELALPQSWIISKGQYPVYLYIGLEDDFGGRVAYAELVVKDETPEYWEMSLISDNLLKDSFERKMNGVYPVENGLSCFSDFETFKIYEQEIKDFYQLHKSGNYYRDVLEKYFKENSNIPKSSRGEDWINYKPAKANGNIIMFGSGYGDGLYPRYVGYGKNGQVVKLVTDFIQLEGMVDK